MTPIRLTAGETWSMFQCPHSAEPMLAMLMLLGLCCHCGEMVLCTDPFCRATGRLANWTIPQPGDSVVGWLYPPTE